MGRPCALASASCSDLSGAVLLPSLPSLPRVLEINRPQVSATACGLLLGIHSEGGPPPLPVLRIGTAHAPHSSSGFQSHFPSRFSQSEQPSDGIATLISPATSVAS